MEELLLKISEILNISVDVASEFYPILRDQFMYLQMIEEFRDIVIVILILVILGVLPAHTIYEYGERKELGWKALIALVVVAALALIVLLFLLLVEPVVVPDDTLLLEFMN